MMNMELFNPFVRRMVKSPALYTGTRFNKAYDYRLFYIESGSTYLYIDGEKYLFKENEMAIIPPGVSYFSDMQSEVTSYVINMDLCFENKETGIVFAEYVEFFKQEKVITKTTWDIFPAIYQCKPNTHLMFEYMYDIYVEKQEYYLERVATLLKALIIESMLYTKHDRTPDIVKELKQYLEKNCGRNITNQDIGGAFSYHPNYINRIFKETTGETVHSYLNEARLKKALRMILESDITVEQIGRECGFSSYAYFIKCFREKYGVSPLKYRNQRDKV